MNALDKAFLKAYEQQPENTPKLMPLSAAIELSRDNSTPAEAEKDANTVEKDANTVAESVAAEEDTAEVAAKEDTAEESRAEHQSDISGEIPHLSAPDFQPLLQVDAFAWPKACERIEAVADEQIAVVAEHIENQARNGRRLIGFIGAQSGSGCSTLLLTVARRLAERRRVAIVDANRQNPGLSRDLGLLPDVGLRDVAAGAVPLDEALVESLDDHLTLLPYSGHAEPDYGADATTSSIDLRQITCHYDIVLVDLGATEFTNGNLAPGDNAALNQIDASLVVQDVRGPRTNGTCRATDILQAAAVDILGIVENRANDEPAIGQDHAFEHNSDSQEADVFYDAA